MQVSLSTGCLYVYPLRKIFEMVRRAGFDGIELVISPELEWRGAEYVRRLSREYAVPILSVHPPLLGLPGWSKIHLSLEPYFDKALRLTRQVGAPLMVVHIPRAKSLDGYLGGSFVHKIVSARERLNGTGPRLALENMSRMRERDSQLVLRELSDLRAFADAYDFPMTFDTSHAGTWNPDLLDALRFFDGRLANVHFSDLREVPGWVMRRPQLHSYLRQHQLPGSGFLPLKPFLRALQARGYPGPITYELSPLPLQFWSPGRVERKLRECVEFVREAVAV